MQMIPFQRGNSSYRGRGRGESSRGRGRGSNILAQYGNKKLVSMETGNTSVATIQQGSDKPGSSYSSAVQTTVNKEDDMLLNNKDERVILLLNSYDKKWENNPWYLYKRYVGGMGYTQETYKSRLFYEELLQNNQCTFQHFTNNANKESYKFSKIIIGKICSMSDWGISPFSEKSLIVRNVQMKYNYWDYIQAFDKVFFYENESLSHTWFVKIMIDTTEIPTWFIKWWKFYGTTSAILPTLFKEYFVKWQEVIPPNQIDYIPDEMKFFLDFSIPWILRIVPKTGYTQELFCLQYKSYSKFWEKMMDTDETGELLCAPTIKLIEEKTHSYLKIKDKEQRGKEIDITLNLWADDSTDINELTEEEIMKAYRTALKETLRRKRDADKVSTSDTSMASLHSQSSFSTLMQDAQNPDDEYEGILLHDDDNTASKWIQGKKESI